MPTDEDKLSSQRAGSADATDAASGFWLAHMRIGFATFLAESLAVLGYLALTPDGPHRRLLLAVVILWIASAILGLAIAPIVCRKPWRTTYSICWTLASSIAVACVAVLDGGSSSPILLLLFLPLIYAALMFTPRGAAACGLGALASYAVVVLVDHSGGSDTDRSVVFLAVLLGGSVLSVAASINRTHMERHERDLRAIITELATIDELTGCLVRRVFHERVDAEIDRAERYDLPLALVMIDIDGFKAINDTYGHVVGDSVLRRVGEVLRRSMRTSDLVGRLGGDEFAVLLPNTDPKEAFHLAERIRGELSRATEVALTVSVGVGAPSSPRGLSFEQLFDDADLALYSVKRGGRNAVAIRESAAVSPR
jgi:diguanylate cyclase (GGDEF)-like protein